MGTKRKTFWITVSYIYARAFALMSWSRGGGGTGGGGVTTLFRERRATRAVVVRERGFGGRLLCLRESDDDDGFGPKGCWHRRRRPIIGKKSPQRQMQKTDVWRKVDEHVTAVVEASFRGEEEEEEVENGLGGVVSDAAALELYLRVESRKQREACEKFASEDETASMSHEKRTTTKESISEAKKAARVLEKNGLVFLKSVVPGDVCDRILADLNATCDECKEMYGDALRRTDVLLGADDDGVKEALEFACGEKGGNIRNILSFIDDATEDAVLVELSVLATEKGADRQVLHPDVAYDAPHETLYSVFIALQDVTQDMGPTLFVLNSHDKRTHDQLPKTKWTEKEFDVLRTKTCAEALLKKGDAVLYNARAFHQGGKNTHGRRALLTLTFLKPPIPDEPTRRNKECLWSIREDVFLRRFTAKELASGVR